jgi:nitrite reductase/ring-hydroxylating ferredoxin subunit
VSRTVRLDGALLPERGRIRVVDAGGKRVGLLWVGEELHAIADACPHRGAPLCGAGQLVHRLEDTPDGFARSEHPTMLRCPWHKWEFDVRTGACPESPRVRARRYRVWLEDGEIVLSFAPVR